MSFWRKISPRGAVLDFLREWRQPSPYRWQALGLAVTTTFALMVLFIPDSQQADPRPPEVTWITTFAPDRTDAEIVSSNIANQERQDAIRAEEERWAERRRDFYRALGRATGIDADKLAERYRDDPEPAPDPVAAVRARQAAHGDE